MRKGWKPYPNTNILDNFFLTLVHCGIQASWNSSASDFFPRDFSRPPSDLIMASLFDPQYSLLSNAIED
jgi:hypothetical protein